MTYDGQSKAAGLHIYLDGQAVETELERDSLSGPLASDVRFRIGQRSRSEYFKGELAGFRIYASPLSAEEVLTMIRQAVTAHYQELQLAGVAAETRAVTTNYIGLLDDGPVRQRINAVQTEYDQQFGKAQTCLIMRDRPQYRETYLLKRGQYNLPDESQALWPAVPSVLRPCWLKIQPIVITRGARVTA